MYLNLKSNLARLFVGILLLLGCNQKASLSQGLDTSNSSSGSTPSPVGSPTPPPGSGSPAIEYFGRFDNSDPAGPKFSWTGSSIQARFNGTSLAVTLNSQGVNTTGNILYFESIVDGGTPVRFAVDPGTKKYSLATGLSSSVAHTILLYRDSESYYGITQFLGFDFGSGGQLLSPQQSSYSTRIEIIGDSITCGWGNTAPLPLPAQSVCDANYEMGYSSYGQQTAQLLNAPPATVICRSGIGMVTNTGSGPTMPTVYDYMHDTTTAPWAFPTDPSKQPTLVIINLGTNDIDAKTPSTEADFETTYVAFIKMVRGHYPNALIFPIRTTNWVTYDFQSIVNKVNDSKVHYIDVSSVKWSGSGCNHPNVTSDANYGAALAAQIKGFLP